MWGVVLKRVSFPVARCLGQKAWERDMLLVILIASLALSLDHMRLFWVLLGSLALQAKEGS